MPASRPLSAEELAESWRVATGYDAAQQGKDPGKNPSRFRPLEGGYMVRFFGQPNNGVGDFQGGLAEHLYLNNGPLGNLIVTGPGSLLAELNKADLPLDQRIERLFLQMLGRPPDPRNEPSSTRAFDGETGPKIAGATPSGR